MSKPFLTCYGLWCSLGAYRGVQDYNKQYNKKYKCYMDMEQPKSKKPEYYYTECVGNFFLGIFVYGNPILIPVFGYMELVDFEKK